MCAMHFSENRLSIHTDAQTKHKHIHIGWTQPNAYVNQTKSNAYT